MYNKSCDHSASLVKAAPVSAAAIKNSGALLPYQQSASMMMNTLQTTSTSAYGDRLLASMLSRGTGKAALAGALSSSRVLKNLGTASPFLPALALEGDRKSYPK